jgi:uncharacterized protein YyaL (SSP411 family)
MMLAALSTYHAGMPQIVIAGDPEAADTRALGDIVRRRYLPTAVVVPIAEQHRSALGSLLPWTRDLAMRGGRATAYVCRNFACQMPTSSPSELESQLEPL